MSAHLDLDALADLLAGEGSDADVAHVGACAACASDLADLDAAAGQMGGQLAALAAVPVPPLPTAVAARLDAALADAVREQAATTPVPAAPVCVDGAEDEPAHPAVDAPRATVTTLPTPRAARQSPPRWLPAAAAAIVLLGGGGLALSTLGGGTTDESSTAAADSAAGGVAGLAGALQNSSGNDYVDRGALQAALPALLAGDGQRARNAVTEAAPPVPSTTASSTAPAAPSTAASLSPQLMTGSADGLQRLRDPAALAACLAALTGPDDTSLPLALDYASYQGRPALVAVLRAPDVEGKVDVFVVGPACNAQDEALVFYTRLDRP